MKSKIGIFKKYSFAGDFVTCLVLQCAAVGGTLDFFPVSNSFVKVTVWMFPSFMEIREIYY